MQHVLAPMLVSPPSGSSTAPIATADPSSIASQVAFDRVKMLFDLTPPPLAGGALFAILVAAMLGGRAPDVLIASWLAPKLVIVVLRAGTAFAFRRTVGTRRVDTRSWLL